jgi:hypothetical protein
MRAIEIGHHPARQPKAAIMKSNSAPWTEAENERLKAKVAKGSSMIRAAAAFKRTTISVRAQAEKLGSPFPPMRTYPKRLADAAVNAK